MVRPGHDGLLDLLEALVQAQVVADRVLPARGRRLEVGEVLAEINKINLLRNYIFMRQNKVPKMGGGKLLSSKAIKSSDSLAPSTKTIWVFSAQQVPNSCINQKCSKRKQAKRMSGGRITTWSMA